MNLTKGSQRGGTPFDLFSPLAIRKCAKLWARLDWRTEFWISPNTAPALLAQRS